MHVELFINDNWTKKDVEKAHTLSFKKIDRFCITGDIISSIQFTGQEKLGLLIDYPGGSSCLESRKKSIASGIQSGIQHFDICISRYHIFNNGYEYILPEIKSLYKNIMEKPGQTCRCLIDFGYFDKKSILDIVSVIQYAGFDAISLSTGTVYSNFEDQLITASIIAKNAPLEILVGPIFRESDYEACTKNKHISGVFFNNMSSFKKITRIS